MHWPAHPCPNHVSKNVSALNHRLCFCFLHFCLADHQNYNAMLSNANMRKYRPYHALPTLLEAALKEHIVQSLALSLHPTLPLHFPVKIKKLGRSETSNFVCVFCSAYHHNGDARFVTASMRKYGPCLAFRTLLSSKLGQTTAMHPKYRPSSYNII